MKGQIVLGLLVLLIPGGSSWARDLIVDGSSAQASDAGAGTSDAPFKTIEKAAETARAGDTVVVRAGVYREEVHLRNSGTANAPILFRADPPGSVVISGADVITGWEPVPGGAPIYRVPWNHIFAIDYHNGKPIEHHPEDAPLWGRAEQVMVDGRQLLPVLGLESLQQEWKQWKNRTPVPAEKTPAEWVSSPLPHLGGPFAGKFAADTTGKFLYLWLADGSDPNKHKVEASTRGQTFGVNQWESREGVSYIQARGFIFRYGASFPQRAVVSLHGSHNLVEDCLVEEMAGSGVAVGGVMRRCLVRKCGQTGGAASGDGFINENCIWEENSWKPINRGWDAGGVKMALVHGGLFRRCVFRHNGGPGLWFDIDCRNVTVTECVFQENEGSGLFVEISRDMSLIRNLSIGNGTGAVGQGGPGDWSTSGIQFGESENCVVSFNTCIGNKDGITFREQGPRPLETSDLGTIPYHDTGDIIVGNVCALNQGYQLGIWYDNGFFGWHPAEQKKYKTQQAYDEFLKTIPEKVYDPLKQGHVIDHNLYYAGPGQSLFLYGVPWRPKHQVFNTLADFTAKTGFDTHSQVSDPMLEKTGNPANATIAYHLQPSSPVLAMQVGWLGAPADPEKWPDLPTWMKA